MQMASHEAAVLKYLSDSNRPYSCVDIVTNLRGACGKTAAQKALDALVAGGLVREKQYGKQKVYVIAQEQRGQADGSTNEQEIKELDTAFAESSTALKLAEDSLKSLDSELRALVSTPRTAEASRLLAEAKRRVEVKNARLAKLKMSSEGVLTKDEHDAIIGDHEKIVREYRKRKRMCTDMLDAILEGYPRSKADLMEELCLETDEDAGFKLTSS